MAPRRWGWWQGQDWSGPLFVLPTLVVFLVFIVFPVLFTLYVSFHDWPLLARVGEEREFVGAANYQEVLTDPMFRKAFWNTVYYTAGSVPTGLMISLGLAVLLILGGVIGAQVGAQVSGKLKAEQLRILLSLLVLGVAFKIALDLLLRPSELYTITPGLLP